VITADASTYRELSVNIDTGGLAARRLLKRMRRNELAPVGSAPSEAAARS